MTVKGMRMNPANERATAPARRFPVFESFGREEECCCCCVPCALPVDFREAVEEARSGSRAACSLIELRPVK